MNPIIEDLKFLVARKLDVEEFLDILGFNMYDLVDEINPDVFMQYYDDLVRACG